MENNTDLLHVLFSWSLDDVFNQDLYKDQVESIPQTFLSVQHYFKSFTSPLLEELRTELSSALETISRAPFAEVMSVKKSKPHSALTYNVAFDHWIRISKSHDKEPYVPLPGDILVFSQAKAETVEDLQRSGRTWAFGCVMKRSREVEVGATVTQYEVKVSNGFKLEDGMNKYYYASFLINTGTSRRIWTALNNSKTSDVIKKVLCTDFEFEESCNMCSEERIQYSDMKANYDLLFQLNESQFKAVATCLSKLRCKHMPDLKLIWGPPGTGKTRTLAVLLVALAKLKHRSLTCAPTNVAISEVASRLLGVLRESREIGVGKDALFLRLGDIVLFGNKDRLKVDLDTEMIFLDHRVEKLVECFGSSFAGWRSCFSTMIQFLEGFWDNQRHNSLGYLINQFNQSAMALKTCVSTICSHLPLRCISEQSFLKMVRIVELLDSVGYSLYHGNELSLRSEGTVSSKSSLIKECLSALIALQITLNELNVPNDDSMREFCLRNASLVLCTASSSYRLQKINLEPFRVLIIDEAAQLKECESVIPLQVPGICHVILLGDECQLPALVRSKVCEEAMYGRSLFERLSLLGHAKHLLNIQYRMHPLISSFPNAKFYGNRITDAQQVKSESYRKRYLPGSMFGPLSFINIPAGKEVRNEQGSWMNMVEVAAVSEIVQLLHKACIASKCKVTVGIVAPYSAQTEELQRKIGRKYENQEHFSLKIKSIDGCQGGEEDIVILSTVRCTDTRSIDFICTPQRINVSLTRARHCLWILGDERTLTRNRNIWSEFIDDAKARSCYFNADENKDIEKVIWKVKKELNQLDDFLRGDSMLFKSSRWKVLFSDNFKKSFSRLKSVEIKDLVLYLLTKLSSGWRPKKSRIEIPSELLSQILKNYMVKDVCVVCSVDVETVEDIWSQVFKVWDVLPFGEISKLVKRLEGMFEMYSDVYIECCKVTRVVGNFVVPVTWGSSFKMTRYKSLTLSGEDNSLNTDEESTDKNPGDNNWLLMKFYSLSCDTVNHLLSACDGEEVSLPLEFTNEQKNIIHFNRSTFILSRSGTGKTSVLTMKLVRNEQLYHLASEGHHNRKKTLSKTVVTDDELATKRAGLRQLFVTVSPKLCYAVKQEILQLQSFVYGEKSSVEKNSIRADEMAQFTDIPDSFVHLSPDSYPLVITYHKFLMMLNGTIGSTYFERFSEAKLLCYGKTGNLRSVALQTFIQRKVVDFDKFSASYWSHFNSNHTRKIDVHVVFTEIMSVIKGGLKTREAHNGLLSLAEYIRLHDRRGSNLSEQKHVTVYDLFLQYEKLKLARGEFDLADLVIDLHRRFNDERYIGQLMDFVFIDEVQDLSMSQIALFQYICRNGDEGFVFSGDTAQTISQGINFRFEDIRCLFYEQFLLKRKMDGKGMKGLVSDIFTLRENFRTHVGVLKLAQSVIELVYHFFPFSIDKLGPETSPLKGETPVLLESMDGINAITAIFGTSDKHEKLEGFGSEQVILVRNDYSRKQIVDYVGNRALVLTILECKGLEFQDVLLYNFFSTSLLTDQWAVIYGYMKDNNLFGSSSPSYFPTFSEEKHNLMCSELKQLYVAVTRTRQRLWICENAGCGEPMFSYWKSLGVVQEKKLDSSLVKEMQVVSSCEDWKDTGMKLLHENNFERAMLCFERAGSIYWSKYTKAAQLRAASAYNNKPNSATSFKFLREAAEIFESIGKAEQAAQCFFEARDYERAGKIYLENCGETKLECAGDCFLRAKCYKKAAEVYARANLFSKCLSSCIDGNFFDMGVQFIEWWKRDNGASEKLTEIRSISQEFLQKAALHFHELEDILSMLKYVRLFPSVDQIRSFLQHLAYFDEFRLLDEERRGNVIGAASIARQKGYYFIEIDLFQNAGYLREASMVIMWYIFTDIVFSQAKKSRLRLQFVQKNELLNKAKSIASKVSNQFHEFVCSESDILSRHKCRGSLFDTELQFIHCWKLKAPINVKRDYEIENFEKDLIGKLAYHYYGLRDCQAMIKLVEAYCSTDLIRSSLRSLGSFNELLWFEKNCGNLIEASEVAGEIEHFEEASKLILNYVCGKSLWGLLGKGWPLKHFPEKEKYLERAKSFARNQNDNVCVEANILDSRETNISVLNEHFIAARKQGSLRSEILSSWKILDAHLCLMPSKFEYTDICVTDLTSHSDFMIPQNRLSVETLIYFWNFWKQKIVMILDHLNGVGPTMVGSDSIVEEVCLNCMGVYKLGGKRSTLYVVLDSDSEWVRLSGSEFIEKNGKVGYIDACNFQSAALGHWSRMLFTCGVEVLKTLKKLSAYSVTTFSSVFLEVMPLAHIFEVSKFLKHYIFHYPTDYKFVNECLALTIGNFIATVFPIYSRKTLVKSLVVLREEVVKSLILDAILEKVHARSKPTYEQIGRILMMALGSYGLSNEMFLKIAIYFENNSTWTLFIKELSDCKLASDVLLVSEAGNIYARDIIVVLKFYEALRATYYMDWKSKKDYMSPSCFLYLIERLFFLVSYFNGYIFTGKASFVEWLIFNGWKMNLNTVNHLKLPTDLVDIVDFMADVVHELLLNERDTKEWIRLSESNVEDHFRCILLRLMVHLCLVCLNHGRHFEVLFVLLNKKDINSQLPRAFCDAIFRRDCYFLDAIAEALAKIGNPLVVVSVGKNITKISCFDALFVNIGVENSKEELMKQLFHNEQDTSKLHSGTEEYGTKYGHPCFAIFWEGFDLLKLEHQEAGNRFSITSIAPKLKVEAEKSSNILSAAMEFFKKDGFDDSTKLLAGTNNMLNDLMDLSSLLDVREELNSNSSKICQILKRLQLRRPRLEPFLDVVLRKYASERQGFGQ